MDGVVQLTTVVAGELIPAVGAVLSLVIVIDSVSVHPLAAVTVTVYVPSVVTLVDAVLSPVDQA